MSFFWYQLAGGNDTWHEALSEHRARVVAERNPAFVTILDAHSAPDAEWDRDQYAQMKYSGPLYFDWDAEYLDDTIPQFQKFLSNLEEMGVNLASLRLYATGGRGFHLEIPPQVFMAKVPKSGVTALPYVYREMAMLMVVDTLDLRVYTGRRGRMWRTINVERVNKEGEPTGKYKVPITLDAARTMTKDAYAALVAVPTPEIERELPELNITLAGMFIKAQTKVDDGLKRRAKSSDDEVLLAHFKGQFPPTIENIMKGIGVAPHMGFQKLSMQLAITANALGKTADQLVEACEDLCKTHEGDSSRYGSPRLRKAELRRMWDYTHDNPCYTYSKGGIRSLLAVDVVSGDLDGSAQTSEIGKVDESEVETSEGLSSAGAFLLEGLFITKEGVHKKTPEGSRTICNLGFSKPYSLRETLPDGAGHHALLGLQAEVLCDSKPCGRYIIPDKVFVSRAQLTSYCSSFGGIFSGSDTQSGVVKLILNRSAERENRVIYALHREGLDVVQSPIIKDHVQRDVVWVTGDKVLTKDKSTAQYVYQPQLTSTSLFNADVHLSNLIKDTKDTQAWLKAVLAINSPTTVAQMLGWFVSTFHRQFYHEAFSQFPLLHPNGVAGSGKTLTSQLFGRLNYMTKAPMMRSCGTVTTQFALKSALVSSSSIPLILDEYKPAEMGPVRTDFLMQAFRLAYNQGKGASGAMGNSSASASFKDISEYSFSTPIVFLAETQEMQTAIVQRSLPVSFHPSETVKREAAWEHAVAGQDHMAQLGRLLLKYSFLETVESRREALTPIITDLRGAFDRQVHDRQVYNFAIVIEGLNFLDSVLQTVFGDALRDQIDSLKQAIYDQKLDLNASVMSEAGKMLNDMSMVSRTEDVDSEFSIREGREYIVRDGYMEILMREAFIKYFSWCKRKGMPPYYSSPEAFIVAMSKFPATLDRMCTDSPLRSSGQSRVFRFDITKMQSEGVEMFKTKSK